MGIVQLIKASMFGSGPKQYPDCPEARFGYVMTTSDMVHFDLLDGHEECGGVELRGDVGEAETWVVHVYGVDVVFPSLRKLRAWLGKPELRLV